MSIAFIQRYSPLSSRLTALLMHVILNEWLLFIARFWISTKVLYVQRCLVATWLVPRETAAVSARSVYTIQRALCHVTSRQSHIRGMRRKRRRAWHTEAWGQRRYLDDWRNCYRSVYNYCTEACMSRIPFSFASWLLRLFGQFIDLCLWWSLCTLYLLACQVRVTVGHSGLCCVCVTSFKRELTPLCVDSLIYLLKPF